MVENGCFGYNDSQETIFYSFDTQTHKTVPIFGFVFSSANMLNDTFALQ